ncbi:MAG: site-specific integrase [Bacteroidetes bacterium]|nr:site-specific integrase [Bacteroidota bacterium]
MSVTLRLKTNKNKTQTFYLDVYVNKTRKREFLTNLKLVKPKNNIDRDSNRQMRLLAEQARNKRAIEIEAGIHSIIPMSRKSIDLLKYFTSTADKYGKKDKRVISASLAKFETFLNDKGKRSIKTNELTKGLVIEFKEYLETKLNGETPSNYFKKFKKVLESLVNEGVLASNPSNGVSIKRNESISKQILTFDEINTLKKTPITNEEVKRAFIFSCFTGLRFSDVCEITHENINNDIIDITQKKTNVRVMIRLHEEAKQILNSCKTKTGKLFVLPTHTACLKSLKVWVKKAEIQKHITWHCARHSFATAIITHGSDISSASALLGHSSYVYTQRYVRVSDKLKDTAISNLPMLD